MTTSAEDLVAAAKKAREQAHAPYSGYAVGAALLTAQGNVFTGCNVENASYGLTLCAERVAITKAVSEGEKEFDSLTVVTGNGGSLCGACRQVLREFGGSITVHIADTDGAITSTTAADLLPDAFEPGHLE